MNRPNKNEHERIARFLKKEFVPYCNKHDYKLEIELGIFLEAIQYSYQDNQDEIAKRYSDEIQKSGLEGEVSQSKISRVIDKINKKLKVFCCDFSINPPIQMFSYYIDPMNGRAKPFGCFLVCAKASEDQRNCAEKIISLKEAKKRDKLETHKAFQEREQQQTSPPSDQPDKLKLYKPTITKLKKGQSPLSYKYCWPETIYGRNNEKKQLLEFVNYEGENLLWWAITGNGGTGKSRLALDLCCKLEKDWHAGFLMDPKEIGVLSDWKPTRHTLIVIDYTYEKSEKLGECIRNYMYENSKQWDFSVRILFLERYAKSEALERFCRCEPDIIDAALLYRKSTNDKSRFLELKSLSDEAIDSITTEVFRREKDKAPSGEVLETIRAFLKEKIHENNPLYAMILAEACTKNERVSEWSIGDLLGRHLERTKKLWKESNIDENNELDNKHINLLTFATITGGVDIRSAEYDECLDETHKRSKALDILPTEGEFRDRKYMVLCEDDNKELGAMSPDILGEYFVLQRWKRGIAEEYKMKLLTKVAWRYKPWGMIHFLTRAAMDFPTDEKLDRIIELAKADGGRHIERVVLLSNLISVHSKIAEYSKAVEYYNSLEELVLSGYQKDRGILLLLTDAVISLTNVYCITKKPDKATECYSRIEALWVNHPANRHISLSLAKITYNLVWCYVNAGEPDKAANYFINIEGLLNIHQKDRGISVELAKAALNLMTGYIKTKDPDKALIYYNRIEVLCKSYPKDKEISINLVRAAFNLSCYFTKAGDPERSVEYYNCIESLWKRYPKDREISLLLASAAANLVWYYAEVRSSGKAVIYYDRIETLLESYPKDRGISLLLASATVDLTWYYAEAGDSNKTVEYYNRSEALWESYPKDREISVKFATAALNLAWYYNRAGKSDKAVGCYNRIDVALSSYPRDSEILYLLANAAGESSVIFREKGDANKSEQYKNKFVELYKSFPESEKMPELYRAVFAEDK